MPTMIAGGLGSIDAGLTHKIPFPPGTLLVQLASSFVSKLAPAGLGPIALFMRYLRRSGLDDASAASLLMGQAAEGRQDLIDRRISKQEHEDLL